MYINSSIETQVLYSLSAIGMDRQKEEKFDLLAEIGHFLRSLFVEFTVLGKYERRKEFLALLDEMLRRNAIERDEYMRLNDLTAGSLTAGEERSKKSNELTSIDGLTDTFIELYKRFKCEGKKEQYIDLGTMLDEPKGRDEISRQSYDM